MEEVGSTSIYSCHFIFFIGTSFVILCFSNKLPSLSAFPDFLLYFIRFILLYPTNKQAYESTHESSVEGVFMLILPTYSLLGRTLWLTSVFKILTNTSLIILSLDSKLCWPLFTDSTTEFHKWDNSLFFLFKNEVWLNYNSNWY